MESRWGMGAAVAAICLTAGVLAGCTATVNSKLPTSEAYESPASVPSARTASVPSASTANSRSDTNDLSSKSASESLAPGTGREFVVVGSGDLMIHPAIAQSAEQNGSANSPDFFPALAEVATRVKSADLGVCHIETPFSQPGQKTKFPHYYVHPNLAKAIAKVGFRECSTASNWTYDKGKAGAERTVEALKSAGVKQSGIRIPESSSPFTIRTVKGVKVAHLSYTDPSDSPGASESGWAVNNGGSYEVAKQAKRARKQGAEIVIVSLAMGSMGSDSATEAQVAAVNEITKNHDVNLVIGHGSHTVQPAQKVNGTWVIWHGNLISSFFKNQQNMHAGLLSRVTFKETSRGVFEVNSATGYPVLTLPGSSHVVDLASHPCSSAQSWYTSHLKQIEQSAIADGFKLRLPCKS